MSKPKPRCHAMTLQFEILCGRSAKVTTIVDGTRKDRLAKLITCATCYRIWDRNTRALRRAVRTSGD